MSRRLRTTIKIFIIIHFLFQITFPMHELFCVFYRITLNNHIVKWKGMVKGNDLVTKRYSWRHRKTEDLTIFITCLVSSPQFLDHALLELPLLKLILCACVCYMQILFLFLQLPEFGNKNLICVQRIRTVVYGKFIID